MLRARATLSYSYSGSPGLTTLYADTALVENAAAAQLAFDRLKDAYTAGLGLFPATMTITGIPVVDQLDPATGALTGSFAVTPWTLHGVALQDGYLPPADQVCVTWVTDGVVAGKRVRGRTFLGPLFSVRSDIDGTPTPLCLTQANAFGDAWTDAGGTDVGTVVWHRPKAGAGGSIHEITGHVVRDKFAVLRSRRD